jgi:hypothetical protein
MEDYTEISTYTVFMINKTGWFIPQVTLTKIWCLHLLYYCSEDLYLSQTHYSVEACIKLHSLYHPDACLSEACCFPPNIDAWCPWSH